MISKHIAKIRKYGLRCAIHTALEKAGLSKIRYSDLYEQRYFLNLPEDHREQELAIWYQSETGKTLDLENPRSLNEKIQWLKLYDATPLKTRLADKYLVRDWVKEKIGEEYLTPLLGVWDSFDEIDFSKLPEQYVLKGVHGSGMNIVVRKDKPINMREAKKKCDYWMKSSYGTGAMQEWHYRDIPHRIMAEQYMENLDGDLYDYKFHCFNGVPKYCQVIKGRNNDTQMVFYHLDWSDAGFYNTYCEKMKDPVEKPKQLDKAIKLAETLAEGFSYVRVDMYLLGDEEIRFGEMTFTPASGVCHWVPEGTDEMLGEHIELPKEKYRNG